MVQLKADFTTVERMLIWIFYSSYNNIELIKLEINCAYMEASFIHYEHSYKPHLITLN